MVGQTISHYRITEKLGEGGMGVVYKAEDTKLERTVALKFLAAHLLNDHQAKQRFLREARAAAAVRHPNICHVHEVGEENGKTFLAMDYLEGESLEGRIAKGPLPLKDVLDIGRQIAEGLEAAHEKGIVHRDIKPANVMIDAKGRATILDFGLARLTEASKLTRADQTVGTAAYMSPEQIQGAEVDQRTDIWALGCVLYEMVAGVRPFKGQYDQALAYEIVQEEPEHLTGLRTGVPIELELLIGKCLAKDRADRPASAEEIARELRTLAEKLKSDRSRVLSAASVRGSNIASPKSEERRRLAMWPWALVGLSTAIALVALISLFSRTAPEIPFRQLSVVTPEPVSLGMYNANIAISPDGNRIAYTTSGPNQKLWVRDLDQRSPWVIEGASGANSPFWSPDSEFIAFEAGGELKKISQAGGPASRLCELPSSHFHGGSFSPDGESIVFSSGEPHSLYEVPAVGGAARIVLSSKDLESEPTEARLLWPHFLPPEAGKRALLFTSGPYSEPIIMAADLETGRQKTIGPGAYPVYSPSGHIVYQSGTLISDVWAAPFSLKSFAATGEAFSNVGYRCVPSGV